MLRTDLIDIINRGEAWAFLGSGVSIDSGGPDWPTLLDRVMSFLPNSDCGRIAVDPRYVKALAHAKYPMCFSVVEKNVGRPVLEEAVLKALEAATISGPILHELANWPFRGYITTNYDMLLERALLAQYQLGWIALGNQDREVTKISGDVSDVVWHVHGVAGMEAARSKLIITQEDYDQMYLQPSSVFDKLKGLLNHRRVVFVGVGFNDGEVLRLVRAVGRLCDPIRPAFAFLHGTGNFRELLEQYNVDILPYEVTSGSHAQLTRTLQVYGALILRRSLRFGQPAMPCPSYDSETTGLLVYNQLALSGQYGLGGDVIDALTRARVLAILNSEGPCEEDSLDSKVEPSAQLLGPDKIGARSPRSGPGVSVAIESLNAGHLVERITDKGQTLIRLTAKGRTLVQDRAGRAEELGRHFSASLLDRASLERNGVRDEATIRIANAAEGFLKDCVEKRALGVARVWYSPGENFQNFHMVGLLQNLPRFMEEVITHEEASQLVSVVRGVLSRPTDLERRYLGLVLQAHFALILLGADPDTFAARARELHHTVFLLDSSTLIPLLGRSADGNSTANMLVDRIGAVGAQSVTTSLLLQEVQEHALWATSKVSGGALTTETLEALTGRSGDRANVFLEGFVEEFSSGKSGDFNSYLRSISGDPPQQVDPVSRFPSTLERRGIMVRNLSEWEGFSSEMWSALEQNAEKIGELRKQNHTYRHERQVRAEAEALMLITGLRNGLLKNDGASFRDAYFVSNTRVVDAVADTGRPITMREPALLQWLGTLTQCGEEQLKVLVDGLIWELSEQGFTIVNESRLRTAFAPLISAQKEQLQELAATHQVLVAARYGENPQHAFRNVSDLDFPVAVESFLLQEALSAQEVATREREARLAAEERAKLTEKDKRLLQRVRAKQAGKKRKQKGKRQANRGRTR